MGPFLRLIREHPDAIEADLQRYYGIDYRDRWRFDEDGRRLLTLRRLMVLVSHLPPDSATMRTIDDQPVWDLEHVLLARIENALTGKPSPLLQAASRTARQRGTVAPDRRRKFPAARRRARARRRAIDAGDIT